MEILYFSENPSYISSVIYIFMQLPRRLDY